ncbi:MAG: hemoglobin-like flavoprotein [Candidatus Azotimanducaceae bacterium]|jgi:hemoglobin-like flavoprotein
MTDPILTSFELAAERAEDITDTIYDKYFAACPESEELLRNVDQGVKGKMIQEVIRLIMVEDYQEESDYLNFEVKFHQSSYSVELHMYSNLLNAVHSVIRGLIGTDWTKEFEIAWTNRLGMLSQELEKRHRILA